MMTTAVRASYVGLEAHARALASCGHAALEDFEEQRTSPLSTSIVPGSWDHAQEQGALPQQCTDGA